MAKIRLGGMAAQASGSVGGIVFSRNRYGAYTRARSIPTKSMSLAAMAAKARLVTCSQGFQSLTAAQKAAWAAWCETNPRTDVFGEKQVLTPSAAYIGFSVRRALLSLAPLTVPPLTAAPAALKTLSLTGDIGAGNFGAVFTATPLGTNSVLWIKACVLDSVGISYVQNLLKLVDFSTSAQVSPYDFQAALELRFGTLQVGQTVVAEIAVCDTATAQLSQALRASVVVTTTP